MPIGARKRLWTSLPALVALLGLVAGPTAAPPALRQAHPLKHGHGHGHRSAKHVRAVSSSQTRVGSCARTVMISGRGAGFDPARGQRTRAGLSPDPARRAALLPPITPSLARSQPIRC